MLKCTKCNNILLIEDDQNMLPCKLCYTCFNYYKLNKICICNYDNTISNCQECNFISLYSTFFNNECISPINYEHDNIILDCEECKKITQCEDSNIILKCEECNFVSLCSQLFDD
jgi:hypothetical protein